MSDAQIFQLLGLAYTCCGVGALITPRYYQRLLNGFSRSPALIYVMGFMVLTIGYLLVTFHNIWRGGWPVIITVIGWMALVKGITMLALPGMYVVMSRGMKKHAKWLFVQALLVLAIGLFFMWIGFFAL